MISHNSRKFLEPNKYLVYNNLFTINFSNIWVNQKLSKQNMKEINIINVALEPNGIFGANFAYLCNLILYSQCYGNEGLLSIILAVRGL